MGSDIIPDAELDCVGLYCPIPIAQTKKEIDKFDVDQMLKVEADDPASEEDIKRWVKRIGYEIITFEREGSFLTFYINKMPNQGIQPKLNTCG
jgi:tRNA 2-thiouridine synthesizing protein A